MSQFTNAGNFTQKDDSSDQGSGQSSVGELKRAAKHATDRMKSTATDAIAEVKDSIGDQTSSMINEKKAVAGEKIECVANALRQSADSLSNNDPTIGRFVNSAADRVEGLSSYIRDHDWRDMYQQVGRFARQHPATLLDHQRVDVQFFQLRCGRFFSPDRIRQNLAKQVVRRPRKRTELLRLPGLIAIQNRAARAECGGGRCIDETGRISLIEPERDPVIEFTQKRCR